jgi:hypothetical protein
VCQESFSCVGPQTVAYAVRITFPGGMSEKRCRKLGYQYKQNTVGTSRISAGARRDEPSALVLLLSSLLVSVAVTFVQGIHSYNPCL